MDFDSLNISRELNTIGTNYSNTKDLSASVKNSNKISSNMNVADPDNKIIESKNNDGSNPSKVTLDDKANDKSALKGNYEESLEKAIKMANKKLMNSNHQFTYSIHEKTNRVMVKVTDTETGEVIREIPSEKSLDLFGKLQELAGIIVDEKR